MGCSLAAIQPHLAQIIGREFLQVTRKESIGLDAFVGTLQLQDLMLAAACLQNDGAAWQRVQHLLDRNVTPQLQRVWRGRVSPHEVHEAVADVPAHCFRQPESGKNVGAMRLAAYRGRALLTTWLFVVADRLLRERLRTNRHAQVDSHDLDQMATGPAGLEPENRSRVEQLVQKADEFSQRLCEQLSQTLASMPSRRRMAAVLSWHEDLKPSEIAELMHVSRPRVSQLLAEAENDLSDGAKQVCQEIADEVGKNVIEINRLLQQQFQELVHEAMSSPQQ